MTAVSFPSALRDIAAQDPDAVAVVLADAGEQTTLTRGELDRASNRTARAYAERGAGHGDLITIGLPNSVEWFVACMAAWKLGAVPNPVSPRLPGPELRAIVERADPALLVGVAADTVPGRTTLAAGFQPDPALSDGALPDQTSPIERALASGGSTGLPKLICSAAPAIFDPDSPLALLTARRAALVPGPLYHAVPYASAWRTLLGGATAVVMARFDPAELLRLVERHDIDHMSMVPTMMLRVARLPEADRQTDVTSLEFVLTSGSPCPPWLMRSWIDWLGPDVMHETFGSTERIGGTHITGREWLDHPGSVGRAAGGSSIRILDPDSGEELPAGEVGEVYMMPPEGPGTSYRYVGGEARRTADGWESIGDMGHLDDEGYLYLGDRRTDMILSGGRNIFPAEVEAAIEAHPKVRSSAVIGLPDDDLGNTVHAIVEADGLTATDLEAHVREHLVHYKVPKTVEFVDHPLRDDAGKVRRSALRDARVADGQPS